MTIGMTQAQRFIVTKPRTTPASELVKAAKTEGLTVSENYVYAVRKDKRFGRYWNAEGEPRGAAIHDTRHALKEPLPDRSPAAPKAKESAPPNLFCAPPASRGPTSAR